MDPLPQDRTQSFLARFEKLDDVRDFVGASAEAAGLDPGSIYAVQMAVDEAFTNIVEHAYGGECDQEIQCTCRTTPESLTIILRDCGHTFDPDAIPDPDLEAALQEREEGGLGLFFMRQLMDEVHFDFNAQPDEEGGCNVLRMVKNKKTSRKRPQ